MGVYSASLNVGAAGGAALTVPLGRALGVGWRAALASWLVLALAALALWLPVAGTGRGTAGPAPDDAGSWSLLRRPLARQVTAYLGLQSVQFYSVAAWLPTLLADAGVPVRRGRAAAGPDQRGRRGRRPARAGAGGPDAHPAAAGPRGPARYVGRAGRAAAVPGLRHPLWVALFGLAQGSGFALALTLIVLRSATPLVAARLGGVAQCLGYLVAAAGPSSSVPCTTSPAAGAGRLGLLLVLLVPMAWSAGGRPATPSSIPTAPWTRCSRTPRTGCGRRRRADRSGLRVGGGGRLRRLGGLAVPVLAGLVGVLRGAVGLPGDGLDHLLVGDALAGLG